MRNYISLSTVLHVFLHEGCHALFNEQTTLHVSGSQDHHTSDKLGNFKHPFGENAHHLESIHYPDSKTFSIKLKEQVTKSKYEYEQQDQYFHGDIY